MGMKVRCGRCGAEYSEIRKVCPRCGEDTKFAVSIEYAGPVEFVKPPEPSIPLEIPQQPKQVSVQKRKHRVRGRVPIFLILLSVGVVAVVGLQLFENYRVDYQQQVQLEEIPMEQINLGEEVNLGYNSFTVLGAESVEDQAVQKYLPENKKIVAVAVKAVEEKYTEKAKNLYSSAFYGYYNGDEYVEAIQSSDVIGLLELEGYLPYYGPSAYEEPGYMFFVVDKGVTELTFVYAMESHTFMKGDFIEKYYQVKLKVD